MLASSHRFLNNLMGIVGEISYFCGELKLSFSERQCNENFLEIQSFVALARPCYISLDKSF